MAAVALDADVIIAFLDPGDDQHERAVKLLHPHLAAGDRILIGASVYAEIMVRPLQRDAGDTVEQFIEGIGAAIVNVDRTVARNAAMLRASHRSLRLPDALSLATARAHQAELITLDHRLSKIARQRPSK